MSKPNTPAISLYLMGKSVTMKVQEKRARLCFSHQVGNKFRNGHIVGINKVMVSPIRSG